MITVRAIRCAFLGIRYRAYCTRCHVDLPGRYTTVDQATNAGNNHVSRWHPVKEVPR